MALLLGIVSQNQMPLLLRNSNSINALLISRRVNSGNDRFVKDYRESDVLALFYCAFKIAILLWKGEGWSTEN